MFATGHDGRVYPLLNSWKSVNISNSLPIDIFRGTELGTGRRIDRYIIRIHAKRPPAYTPHK